MPKYYIDDGLEKAIVSADNAVYACIKAVAHYFNSIPVGGYYDLSEVGYYNPDLLSEDPDHYLNRHLEDIRIPANLVLEIIEQMHQDRKKRDKDLDNE